MKMWVSVTSSGEVSSIIKQEDLAIEVYTERLVTMFNAIVSRDAQSPHGKFYFVAKRLQQRFTQIKEGARADTADADTATTTPPRQPPGSQTQTQTPLHLLSEVAMGSNPAPHAHAHAQQQAQAQAALQAQSQSQSQLQQQHQQQQHQQQQQQQQHQQQQQPWYPGPDVLGLSSQQPGAGAPQAQSSSSFDPNFDFTQFDLGTGSDADLSALFIPDSMMWSFAEQPIQGFPGF
jgi:hypothetical protein